MRLAGVELYFDDLERAKSFYRDVLGLVSEDGDERFSKFAAGAGFICLERRGSEAYPSRDKAVIFLHVDSIAETVERIGLQRFAHVERGEGGAIRWAVLHDPEGHNVLLVPKTRRETGRP